MLLLSRDSKAHPCIAASVCLVLLGVQAAVSNSGLAHLHCSWTGHSLGPPKPESGGRTLVQTMLPPESMQSRRWFRPRQLMSIVCVLLTIIPISFLHGLQTSGLRMLNTRSTLVGLWEVWLAHMVAFGVGADEGNSIGVSASFGCHVLGTCWSAGL